MIHIVDPTGYAEHRDLLDQMFVLRAAHFHTRRNWRVIVRDGREMDVFDDLGPVYVVNADENGRVRGSLRLLPTTGPHMLADVFPDIMDGEAIVRHPLIWESSRFNVDTKAVDGWSRQSINTATGELLAGLFEAAELIGLRQIVSVYDVAVARILARAGCDITPLGKKIHPDGLATVAGLFAVGPEVTAELRARAGLMGSVLAKESALRLSA